MAKEIKDMEAYKARQKKLGAEATKPLEDVLGEKAETGKYEFSRAYNKLYKKVRAGSSHINKQVSAGILEDKEAGLAEMYKFLNKCIEEVEYLVTA
jgi:hypothetical protein